MRKFLSLLLALLLFLPLVPTAEVHAASSMRGELFRLINQERTKAGLSSLNANSYLNACSVVRIKELFQSPSHTRPDGRDWRTVLEDKKLPVDVAYSGEIWCGGYCPYSGHSLSSPDGASGTPLSAGCNTRWYLSSYPFLA